MGSSWAETMDRCSAGDLALMMESSWARWVGKCVGRSRRRSRRSPPVGSIGSGERGLWVECHMEEFCVKVLKFEIMNSRKSFNYFSGIVPRTIKTLH